MTCKALAGECPANGGTAVHSEREMYSHLRRRTSGRSKEPENRTVSLAVPCGRSAVVNSSAEG